MRFSAALVTLAVASYSSASAIYGSGSRLVSRQSLPDCADNCYATATSDKCQMDDEVCLCNDQTFVMNTTICVEEACSGQDLTDALNYSTSLCAAVGVTLTSTYPIPSSTSGSSGSSTSSSSTSSTSSTSSSSTSQTPAPTAAGDNNSAITHGVNALSGLAIAGAIAFVL